MHRGLTHIPVIRVLFLGEVCFHCQSVSLRKSRATPCFTSIPTAPACRRGPSEDTYRSKSFAEAMHNFHPEKKVKDTQFN